MATTPKNFVTSTRSCVRIVPYVWGEDISSFLSSDSDAEVEGFGMIVAADTLWNVALHEAFARMLYLLLRRKVDARIHLVAGLHTGRYALSSFLRLVRSIRPTGEHDLRESDKSTPKLQVMNIIKREVNCDRKRKWKEDRGGEDDAERWRWVVWIVLGWVGL